MRPPAELCEPFLALFEYLCDTLLVSAWLFLAVLARERCVGVLGESLGVELIHYLPKDEEEESETEQAPGINVRNKEEGSKHHCIIPIVDAAVCAALVLQEPVADRAEEEDAHDIAHAVSEGDENEYTCVNHTCKIEHAEHEIERYPAEGENNERLRGSEAGLFFTGRYVVSLQLLLTSDGLELGGEDTEHHTREEEYPHDAPEDGVRVSFTEGQRSALDLAYYVVN